MDATRWEGVKILPVPQPRNARKLTEKTERTEKTEKTERRQPVAALGEAA
jgi:hypothetical protein